MPIQTASFARVVAWLVRLLASARSLVKSWLNWRRIASIRAGPVPFTMTERATSMRSRASEIIGIE
jgi:hypothetical protein